MEMALVHILHEMTFLGFDHKKWKRRKAETERSLRKAEKEAERGVYLSSEEVFAKFHLPEDEPDEIADSLYRKATLAQWEYNRHCRAHEARKVRELLLKEQA